MRSLSTEPGDKITATIKIYGREYVGLIVAVSPRRATIQFRTKADALASQRGQSRPTRERTVPHTWNVTSKMNHRAHIRPGSFSGKCERCRKYAHTLRVDLDGKILCTVCDSDLHS